MRIRAPGTLRPDPTDRFTTLLSFGAESLRNTVGTSTVVERVVPAGQRARIHFAGFRIRIRAAFDATGDANARVTVLDPGLVGVRLLEVRMSAGEARGTYGPYLCGPLDLDEGWRIRVENQVGALAADFAVWGFFHGFEYTK